METLYLKAMLYLQLIFSPGEYYQSELWDIYYDNEPAIQEVLEDPEKVSYIEETFLEDVENIDIPDFEEDN